MPKYYTIIDPNLNAADGLWVPSEFEAFATRVVPSDVAVSVELACVAATGRRLPFGFGHAIARLAVQAAGSVRAECAMRAPIPGLDPAGGKQEAQAERTLLVRQRQEIQEVLWKPQIGDAYRILTATCACG